MMEAEPASKMSCVFKIKSRRKCPRIFIGFIWRLWLFYCKCHSL